MLEILRLSKYLSCFLLLTAAGATVLADAETSIDRNLYIPLDQIKPGTKAYCLTVFKGTEIEKFELEVLSIIRGFMPGKDAILVKGLDERFIHNGAVKGCSGSPVYIDGRMAGALAYGAPLSKDPIYFVTPIEEILSSENLNSNCRSAAQISSTLDLSAPIDLKKMGEKIISHSYADPVAATQLPLVTSALPHSVMQQMTDDFRPLGLVPVFGPASTDSQQIEHIDFRPGACLAIPVVSGDISMTAIGTVTQVVGDKLYALGHPILGYGDIDLPMATGTIHAVISNLEMSFKIGQAMEIQGALRTDNSSAVYGIIGAEPQLIPMRIKITRYNDIDRIYNCRLAANQLITPMAVRYSLLSALLMKGSLPPEHLLRYKALIDLEGSWPISFENISSGSGLGEIINQTISPLIILMNNPYHRIKITNIDLQVQIEPETRLARILTVSLNDTTIKPGRNLEITVVLESYLKSRTTHKTSLRIPPDLPPGTYELLITGFEGRQDFLRRTMPHKFTPRDLPTLTDALNTILNIRCDKLYCILLLPAQGITIHGMELPDLPASKTILLFDPKRTLRPQSYAGSITEEIQTDSVILDTMVMQLTIEE
ncbi:MAG: SpoIVB peptidase S55 domain-containing protein [Planctomycetota bacterium]